MYYVMSTFGPSWVEPEVTTVRRLVKRRVLEIARSARAKGRQNSERLAQAYQRLLAATGRVVGQAKRFAKEIDDGIKRAAEGSRSAVLEGLRRELERVVPLVQQVMGQTKARVFAGDTHAEGKIVSLFEPTTEVISQGQGRQADRVRQNGQTAGGGEPDRHRL